MLLGGGTLLVRGASRVAARYGVPTVIVALTVVAFGTSAPELVVNVFAAARGATDLAFGNVIGSNISNLALVLGAAAVMAPLTVHGQVVRRELPLLLLATSAMAVMALDGPIDGGESVIGRSDALVLLLLFCVFVYSSVGTMAAARSPDALIGEIESRALTETERGHRFGWSFVAAGIVSLFAGGELTIRGGVGVAENLGISASIVGLFMVAIGTSMPELVTSVIAAARRESDLVVGNVVGSNIFNSLMVLPASSLTHPIAVPRGGLSDVAVSWILAAALIPLFIFGRAHMGRRAGCVLLAVYAVYVMARIGYDAGP